MKTATAKTIHNLPVLTSEEAATLGFQSITTAINATTEKEILANVAAGRNSARAAFIRVAPDTYELALKREDVSDIAE